MSGKVKADPLFLGLTRPPMVFGVSYNFASLNFIICVLIFITTANPVYLAIIFPIHGLGFYICLKEPLFMDLFRIKSVKCPANRNKLFHKGNSYDPC